MENGTTTLQGSLSVSNKVKYIITILPSTLPHKCSLKRNENLYSHKNLYVNVSAALLPIAKNWKQPSCPSTGERIKEVWYIHKIENYPATKSNTHSTIQMNLLCITPKERNQTQKLQIHDFIYMSLEKAKL